MPSYSTRIAWLQLHKEVLELNLDPTDLELRAELGQFDKNAYRMRINVVGKASTLMMLSVVGEKSEALLLFQGGKFFKVYSKKAKAIEAVRLWALRQAHREA